MTPPLNPDTLNDERRPTVFISYHRASATAFARQLIPELERAGHACWIDTLAIEGGDEWINAIVTGINNSYALIVLVTTEALRSRWVQREIWFAEQKAKRIIPCLLQPVAPEDYFFLANYQSVSSAFADLLRALPSPPAATVRPTSATAVSQRELELAYLDRLTLEELINTDKYTPLGGASQQQTQFGARRAEMRAVFELMPLRVGKAAHELAEPRRFENAVEEILKLRRAVLLGEPGGGKTTTIWKLAAELVERARQDAQAPIPLLIRLGRWTKAEQSLPEFIAAELGELGEHLDALLNSRRAALLLDGLNELPAAQHALKYPLVQKLIEQHPNLLAIVSCRALDYTIDLKFNRIDITPLDPLRIREFVTRYLGETQGEALFWRLAGEELRTVWTVWQKAGASFEMFWTVTEIPKENPNVYGATSTEQDRIWQTKEHATHTLMELARNPYMLLMLTSVYAQQQELPDNRGELFKLFVETLLQRERIPEAEQTSLTDGLARVAFEMQTRRAPNDDDDEGNALTVLPQAEVKAILNDRLLYLAGSASLLNVGDEVRFSHQLLQEYFAAQFMDSEIKAERLAAASLWKPENWWERNNWEEAAILLAGLYSNDCTPIVEWLADAQPEIAAQCLTRSGAAVADTTREQLHQTLRDKWLPRLNQLQREPQPQARAALGRALGQTGLDNRPGVALDVNGLPDIAEVVIPAGSFKYGDDKDANAAKPQTLTLPAFRISRYPITAAQWQAYVDDNGYGDDRWWQGLAVKDDERQPREQRFKFANHPRETVNWFEAMAFCRWLSFRWGGGYDLKKIDEWKARLPTEFEWERAARGTDGRLYPYSNDYDAAKGNVRETGIGQTSAVGIFPNGASPDGVEEMSGNVWEWCLSDYDKPQLEARKEKLTTTKNRVLRGGSWYGNNVGARAAYRLNYHPAYRDHIVGFRVAVGRPPSFL